MNTNDKPILPDPERARMFAELAHSGQTYNNEVPYSYHLTMVVTTLSRFGFSDVEMICAAYLHDTIEDTNRSYNDLKSKFGEAVAELVYDVTSELGHNRKERNLKTYPKIKANPRAVALKLADRIANVEYGAATGGKQDMYAKEFPDFMKAIRTEEGEDPRVTRMWAHLARLF